MQKNIKKDDIYERKPDEKNRKALSEADKIKEARENDQKVEIAVLGVVEEDE